MDHPPPAYPGAPALGWDTPKSSVGLAGFAEGEVGFLSVVNAGQCHYWPPPRFLLSENRTCNLAIPPSTALPTLLALLGQPATPWVTPVSQGERARCGPVFPVFPVTPVIPVIPITPEPPGERLLRLLRLLRLFRFP